MILFEHIRQFKQRHFERRTLSRCKPFSLLICRDISKFSLLVFLLLYRRFAQTFVQNHGSYVEKVHFLLTCTALSVAA